MSDLSKIHSCSGLVKLGCRKPSMLVSGGQGPSSSVDVSNCDTPGPDPVPIAGDRRGSPDSSDPVSTASRRGDGSHCDDGPFSPARCSPITSSGYTEVGFGCWTPYRKMIICLQDHLERCRKYSLPYLDQSTLQINNVARRRGRQASPGIPPAGN